MNFEPIIFYFFSTILIASALCVITTRNPVHATLFLVLCFVTAAALWILLQAEFLAITLILVYVGAVMVLFLFVVMMLDINIDRLREGFWGNLPIASVIGFLMVIEMGIVLWNKQFTNLFPPVNHVQGYSNTKELGRLIYTQYVYPFEIAAIILLVAIIAAIALTMRRRKNTRYQDPEKQVVVKKEDRIKLVSMPVEKND